MTEQKQENKRALIEYAVAKPFVDATALGLAIGGPAALSGNFIAGFVAGSSFSLFWYWGRGNLVSKRRAAVSAKMADYITVNSANGSRQVRRFEQVAPGYIVRESYAQAAWRLIRPQRPEPVSQPPVNASRPGSLDQFAFISWDNSGAEVQLLSNHVRHFLRRAWLYQNRGQGLGRRFWDTRNKRGWPEWYPGPYWYEAVMRLLVAAQKGLGRQLIVKMGHQQIGLRFNAQMTYEHLLYWYTKEK